MKLKEALFELIEIPEPMGPVSVTLDRAKALEHAFAVDDFGDWYFKDSPFGGPVGHPVVLANDLLFLFYQNYDGNTAQGLHTHETLKFHAPLRMGETVEVSGGYTEKEIRRGQGYVTLEATARKADGTVIIEHIGQEIMRTVAGEIAGKGRAKDAARKRSVQAVIDPTIEPASMATHGLQPGTPLAPMSFSFTQEQLQVFSWAGKGYSNVHTHMSRAVDAGLERPIVQGLQQTCVLAGMFARFFGESWFTSGELDLRFVSPAFVTDVLTARAVVLGEENGRLELETWVEHTNGKKTALGWASAEISESRERPTQLL